MPYFVLACRCLIGLVFAVSAFGKLRGRTNFREFAAWLATLPVAPSIGTRALAAAIAASEVGIVVLVALPWTATAGLLLAAGVLAVFTVGVFRTVRAGAEAPCHCFGPSATPLRMRHVARDTLLGLAALAAAAAGVLGPAGMDPAGAALSLGAAVVASLLVLTFDDLAALAERQEPS